MYVIKQLDHYLHSEQFQYKVNGNYHLLNVPANMSVFNKKGVVIPLKKVHDT
jgi:hypothetical protein